ncbi:MAG: LuxR C-terminal-related transcriptional regulator [Erysipelotrichaceae bacterium]|nr:LuxR C-terminal-related transcriptional regulator [Erysipelotrichaceae bacterium]
MKYIKTGNILNLLEQADEEHHPIFINGPIGCGKTAAVEYYYRRISHCTIDCSEGYIEQKTLPAKIRGRVVIFDDVSYLEDENSRKYILDMLANSDKQMIFLSRAPRPAWLISKAFDDEMILADHRDMRLSKEGVFKFLVNAGVEAPEEEMLKVLEDARSNPLVLYSIAFYMKDTGVYSNEVNTFARINYHTYLDRELLGKLTEQESDFLLAMSWFPSFPFELARELNDGLDCRPLVDSIQKKNAYILTFSSAGVQLMDSYIDYLRHKRQILWSEERHRDNLCRAAEFYRRNGNIRTALSCLKTAHADSRFYDLLEETAKESINAESVNKLIGFYKSLEEKDIEKSWPLTAAMAMAESLGIKPAKADYWFDKLKSFYEKEEDPDIKLQIKKKILFLDLMMPHRGNRDIERRIDNVLNEFLTCKNGVPKEYIDMMPTVLHGALDFCEASKDEAKLIAMCEKMVKVLKGRASGAVVDILRAEIGYEKDTLDDFEIHRLLDRGYMIADSDDSFAGCFSSVGVSVHLLLFNGNQQRAEELLEGIRKKAVDAKNDLLLRNIDALYGWVDQLHSNRESVSAWMETTPDEGRGFTFLERSIMIGKIRGYIIMGRFDAAMDLIERMLTFLEMYDRVYGYYEVMLYKAIVLYRMKQPEYERVISEVMKKCCELGFYHLISDQGSAAKPLIESVRPSSVSKSYYEKLIRLTRQMAENFPNYLETVDELKEPLTRTERRVLHLLCEGLNADEICDIMEISYSGIKFHNKNIYRKLGVTNRNEAVRKAFLLGLREVGTMVE